MSDYTIYYGTAHSGDNDGIYSQTINTDSGALGNLERVAKGPSAGFQVLSRDRSVLYSICQVEGGEGAVRSYRVDPASGSLELISEQTNGGGKPCFVGLDRYEEFLFTVSYNDAVITVFPLDDAGVIKPKTCVLQHEGGTQVHPDRQDAAHTHSIYVDPTNYYIFVCDLGEDQIVIYTLDRERGILIPAENPSVDTAPGAGPRHLAFHPNGRWVYVINELNSTITRYDWDADSGLLAEGATVATLPSDFGQTNITAEVVVSKDGRFVYGSNRGHDSIVVCAIEQESGDPSVVQIESTRGAHPRNFNITPDGAYLISVNRDSDNATFFKIDQETGKIEYTGTEVAVPQSICVKFA